MAAELDEFTKKIMFEGSTYSDTRDRPLLEKDLESIISKATLVANTSSTRKERKKGIINECCAAKKALKVRVLTHVYMYTCRYTGSLIRTDEIY